MPRQKIKDSLQEFERALEGMETGKIFVLKLYVSGATQRSTRAIENIRKFCEEHLKDRYELQIIDIYQQPELLKPDQVIAAPTLVKELPLPMRKLIGDMSKREKIFIGLDIKPEKKGRGES